METGSQPSYPAHFQNDGGIMGSVRDIFFKDSMNPAILDKVSNPTEDH